MGNKFTEAQLEAAIIDLLGQAGYPHVLGESINRDPSEVLITDDLSNYLTQQYAADGITTHEIASIVKKLQAYSAADLYESNKAIMKLVADGFLLKREDRSQKDLYIQLIDYSALVAFRQPDADQLEHVSADTRVADKSAQYSTGNIFKMVNQLEIVGDEMRIPDGILYINGLPLVVCEFKSAIREAATIHDAYVQLTTRYRRDIPELFKYNAFCVISDGVNTKAGSFFAPYDFYYAWRKVSGDEQVERDGINALYTMIHGLFDQTRLCDVIRNFVYVPDTSRQEAKIFCRYPQYYAATKLFRNICMHMQPDGDGLGGGSHPDGKGGTYFGATGCGKSLTMLFLARLLMKSVALKSPTIVLITDRTDLDDQLSATFTNAKNYIGDQHIVSVESRSDLRAHLHDRSSGGVFLTTIHKFTEDTQVLTERNNVICISDEAHRSQTNLDQKITLDEKSGTVKKTYGFAKYLHDSLPNATYVGFTGTPIDATTAVFGPSIDTYTMTESVADDITVPIVYEGRAARVLLDNGKLRDIENYYNQCDEDGASDYAIDESKKAMTQMRSILGDPDRLAALAKDFVEHYDKRTSEGATVDGKALFVGSNREITYALYQEIIALRPAWAEQRRCAEGSDLSEQEQKEILPMEQIKMVMTRGKDDPKELYDMLGTKEYRKQLDRQFKNRRSNFKIAMVVDMWLTGFDVPSLDTIYIDKPVQQHNLIQTISRVNRKFEGKFKGLVVDYIGIKKQMNLALAQYSKSDEDDIEDIQQSLIVVKDHLALLNAAFQVFDSTGYFKGSPSQQLDCLNRAAEFVLQSEKQELRFMGLVKRLKSAYDLCCSATGLSEQERDQVHFYLAIRSIVYKLTQGNAPDSAQMNARVQAMIIEALRSDGVEEVIKIANSDTDTESEGEVDLFSPDYLAKLDLIKLPNTKIQLLQQLLRKAIAEFKKVNKIQGLDFSKKFQCLVELYNDRNEADTLRSEVLDELAEKMTDLIKDLQEEMNSFEDLGIDLEEKSFYDILKTLAKKYDFDYPEDKLLSLAKKVKQVVDDKAAYTDWSQRDDIKADLKVDLIILLAENGYPPVDRDEVYKEIFEQAENFKKYRSS